MGRPFRILLLAGTSEARLLAEALAGDPRVELTVSLAGQTSAPRPLPGALRTGGFGGSEGLARYIDERTVDTVIDATHPFATQMSRNARLACAAIGCPLLRLERPGWQQQPGDRWHRVATLTEALAAIGPDPSCILVTVGKRGLGALEDAPQHLYLIRSVEPPDPAPTLTRIHYLPARGPFRFADEIALMRDYGVAWLISKDAGGESTYAKIEAARRLAIPVALISREAPHDEGFATVRQMLEEIDQLLAAHEAQQ